MKLLTNWSISDDLPVIMITFMTSIILLLTGGCIPLVQRDIVPFENLPSTYSIIGEEPAKINWWLDFNDPELNKLIDVSVNDNFSIRTAKSRIDELQANARIAGASLIPTIDAKVRGTATNDYSSKTSGNAFLFEFAASYEIDLWGRLRSKKDAALLDVQAGQKDLHTAVITVTSELAQTWYKLSESNLQLDLLKEQTEINSKILDLIGTQFRAGKTGVADVLQQEQLVESNGEDLANLRAEIRQTEHQLAILLGKPPTTLLLPKQTILPNLPPLPEAGIPLDLLTTRPDIMSYYLKLKASDYRVASAIADRFPKLSISASFNSSSERAQDLFNNWFSSLGANLFGPLIDGGKRKAEVDRSKAIAAQDYLQYGQLILQAIGEVEDALVNEIEQHNILKSRQNQLRLATQTIEHVGNRYRQGLEDYQRVLTALLSHQNLQRNILKSKRTLINNRIALYRATSGRLSFSDTIPRVQDETSN